MVNDIFVPFSLSTFCPFLYFFLSFSLLLFLFSLLECNALSLSLSLSISAIYSFFIFCQFCFFIIPHLHFMFFHTCHPHGYVSEFQSSFLYVPSYLPSYLPINLTSTPIYFTLKFVFLCLSPTQKCF